MRWFDRLLRPEGGAERHSGRTRLLISTALMAALVAGGAAGDALVRSAMSESQAAIAPQSGPAVSGAPATFADIAARVKPAVVSVQVRILNTDAPQLAQGLDQASPFGDLFRHFGLPFEEPPVVPREGQAQGSGFFISPDGYIVTNNHVVANARGLTVTLDDGRTVAARVIAADPRTDLAVIKTVSGANYPFVSFTRTQPRIGDWVLAVGNPFGLGGTVTAGIVSANGRDIGEGPYDDFLQIDAPVNQGNSGGPAFNLNGEVIGINTAIYTPSGGSVGIAFAIPASTAQPIVEQLERGGQVSRGYLGVALQPVDDDIAHSLGLNGHDGALIASVTGDSPAARAGLRAGDIVTRAAGETVSDTRDLARIVAAHRPGSHIDLQFVRSGRRMDANVTLAAMPDNIDAISKGSSTPRLEGEDGAVLGLGVAPVEGGLQVVSVDPSSAAAERGVSPGDIILEAGGRPCRRAADLESAVAAARRDGRGAVLLRVQSDGAAHFVGLPLSDQG
jgi:serine protease Do